MKKPQFEFTKSSSMKFVPLVGLILILIGYSCKTQIKDKDIEGLWYMYDGSQGYSEVLIDSAIIFGFTTEFGTLMSIPFHISNDSIHYTDRDFSAPIWLESDTSFSMAIDTVVFTFYRLEDSLRYVYQSRSFSEEEFDLQYARFMSRYYDRVETLHNLWFEKTFHMPIDCLEVVTDTLEEFDFFPVSDSILDISH